MSSQLSIQTFIQVLSRSELLERHQMDQLADWVNDWPVTPAANPASPTTSQHGSPACSQSSLVEPPADPTTAITPEAIVQWLIGRQWITEWQAEKLLQGKHRGFALGQYVIQDKVARGGMSTIYAGRHRETGELHALKVLPLSKTYKASYLPRFRREAELAGRLVHPNIVRVYQIHQESDGRHDVYFMAMELLPGRDLFDLVNEQGALPCRHAARFIRQAAFGLQFAHDAGLVHRDVKPGNLFLHDDGNIRLLDLGLANDFESDESLTREYNERVLGTADYLSPEQAIDSHLADARSDIYSLGCTFYFLLTGRPPFYEGSLTQRILAHQTRTPEPVHTFRSDVPSPLIDLLSDMLQKDCRQRVQSAAAVADRLGAWLLSVADDPRHDVAPSLLKPTPHSSVATNDGHAMQLRADSPAEMNLHEDQQHQVQVSDETSPKPDPVTKQKSESKRLERTKVSVRRQSDSPTDAVRSSRPLTTPPESRKSLQRDSPYLPEFQQFLSFLDQQMGVDTVLTDDAQQVRLRDAAEFFPRLQAEHPGDRSDAELSFEAGLSDERSLSASGVLPVTPGSSLQQVRRDVAGRQHAPVRDSVSANARQTATATKCTPDFDWRLWFVVMSKIVLLMACVFGVSVWLLFPEVREVVVQWTSNLNQH